MSIYRGMLRVAACVNFLIAAGHLLVPLMMKPIGPWTAPKWAEGGLLYVIAFGVAGGASVLGIYTLSGGGVVRKLPFLRTVLVLAGVGFLTDLVNMGRTAVSRGGWDALSRPGIAPFVLIGMGVFYLVATRGLWNELGPSARA